MKRHIKSFIAVALFSCGAISAFNATARAPHPGECPRFEQMCRDGIYSACEMHSEFCR
ncbi:MAG: hypothetical protein RL748_1750 [Pseudomonadota bacterium]